MNRQKYIFLFLSFIFTMIATAQNSKNSESYMIPQCKSIAFSSGEFILNQNTTILSEPSTKKLAHYLSEQINNFSDIKNVNLLNSKGTNKITLKLDTFHDKTNNEYYKISIIKNEITISAKSEEGLFRGIHTLLQLFPLHGDKKNIAIPCCEIEDEPAFSWRGLHLDCCRHFMTKDFIKRYIDIIAHYKFNKFHWRLSEDQAWRIEIKKYPKLTSVGAWRKEADGSIYGGFYTQDDVKEIVAYAKSRYIDVIPEIEMPGHTLAALASYPEFSCSGGPFDVGITWGVFKDIYCAGNDSTFVFLQNILDEIIRLFPYTYIHIGGDEAPKDRWKTCLKCQSRLKTENLKDEEELQTYFIKRIANYLKTKGKKIVGWDEILKGGLIEGATVQAWTGFDGAIKAAKQGQNVICSPVSYTYFDYDPNDIDLKLCYSFNPIPKELSSNESKFIIGSEAHLWTENAPQETVDSKLFPRILASSEIFWTNNNKNYDNFYNRVQNHYPHLAVQNIKFGREGKSISSDINFNDKTKTFHVKLNAEEKGINIRYTLDEKDPDLSSKEYTQPIQIGINTTLKVTGFKMGKPINSPIIFLFSYHKALGSKIDLKIPYNEKYRASGPNALIDGIMANENSKCGQWQGYEGTDVEAIIDLGKETEISKIALNCLQDVSKWIFFPESIDFFVSSDNINFKSAGSINNIYPQKSGQPIIKSFTQNLEKLQYRFIKVIAKSIIKCPVWHPGAGEKAWIFTDEIVVE